jgi:signal transduction histidine kinase
MSGEDAEIVLAVDDEPANQRAIRRALLDDYRVLTAGSGAQGLAMLREEPVALVIADHMMPGMSGIEFLLHAAREYPHVVRMILTGYADVAMLTEAINQGHVYHFLHKPWEALELRQAVRRGIEKRVAEAERARLLAEVEQGYERVRREADRKSRLLALAAHELGTPTHIVINALDLVGGSSLPEAASGWLAAARRAGDWLVRGVSQLHTASRIGVRGLPMRPSEFALDDLVRQTVRSLEAALRGRDVSVATSVPGRCEVEADREWVRLALWNLLTNAVRLTPDGGAVNVVLREQAGVFLIAVCDTGIGIAPEHLGELFDPFSGAGGDPMLHGSGTLEFGARGLGLGLATVREVAGAHGGRVDVESRLGVGSRFTLHLPKRRATAEAAQSD